MWMPLLANDIALLLDVDGTLLEIAPAPNAVRVPPELPEVLDELALRLDGALALVSGRQLHELDELFSPYRFCAAGVHGCELRYPSGVLHRARVESCIVDAMFDECRLFASNFSGLTVENKTFGVAIHYRSAPGLEPEVRRFAQALIARHSCSFVVQSGKCVYEIKPAGYSKGTAILALTQSPLFRARRPVFIGDDVTDEDGFRVVNSLGGVTLRVGKEARSLAQRRLTGTPEVHRFLARLLMRLGTPAATSRMIP